MDSIKLRYREKFLKHIGSIIKQERLRMDYTQDYLAKRLEIDSSTLSRYEKGIIDISASMLADISYECSFPVETYFTDCEGKKLSDILREVIEYSEGAEIKHNNDNESDIDMYDPQERIGIYAKKKSIFKMKVLVPISENEIQEMEDRINAYLAKSGNGNKRSALEYIKYMIDNNGGFDDKNLRTIARATIRYISDADDKNDRKLFSDYVNIMKNGTR